MSTHLGHYCICLPVNIPCCIIGISIYNDNEFYLQFVQVAEITQFTNIYIINVDNIIIQIGGGGGV